MSDQQPQRTDHVGPSSHGSPPALPRTAVVTGAGRGIGRGIALGLAARGYDVALVGRTQEHLRRVEQEIAEAAGRGGSGRDAPDGGSTAPRTVVVPVDVTDAGAVGGALLAAEEELGGVGLLVNNAGVVERSEVPLAEDDVDDLWRVIETNVRGPILVTHALVPGMVRRGGGRVVNINSGSAYRAGTTNTGYGVSKGALARLTVQLDAQYRDQGLRVFDLAPGVVQTDMTAAMGMHAGRTEWTPVEASVDLLLAIGDGQLDALTGRFLRAGGDTVDELVARTYEILVADARVVRLVRYGAQDPVVLDGQTPGGPPNH